MISPRCLRITTHKKNNPSNRPWRPIGLWDVEAPTFSRQRLTDGGEVTHTRRPLFTFQEESWYSFLLEDESILGL
jgi:hypothetical protein